MLFHNSLMLRSFISPVIFLCFILDGLDYYVFKLSNILLCTFNLLLISSSVFFIADIVFFISSSSLWLCLYIFCVSS